MNKISINVPHEIKYISDWDGFTLPQEKCIINKTVCGCGFTEFCLRNNLPTILCSPRKLLLKNKYEQHLGENIYLVINDYEKNLGIDTDGKIEISNDEPEDIVLGIIDSIKNYISMSGMGTYYIPKILVTYDSLKHVLKALGELGCNYTNSFYYVVDEFQSIFIDSRFKASVEMDFVEYLSCLQYVTYVSATPMLDKYLEQLDEFKNLPYYEFVWDPSKIIKPVITRIKTKSINESVGNIINNYRNGIFPQKVTLDGVIHESKEVVFFVNSVTAICGIIKKLDLLPEETNIICSRSKKNEIKLRKVKHKIGDVPLPGEPWKMFTFCTRTTYLGADFYSPCASTVICSDCNISSLSLDISLDLPQIMGRQRLEENVFRYEAIIFYKGLKEEYSEDEFNEYINKKKETTRLLLSVFNKATKEEKQVLVRERRGLVKNEKYSFDYVGVSDKTGESIVNKLVLLSEQRAFEVQQKVYRDDVSIYNELKTISEVQELHNEIINFFNQFELLSEFRDSYRFLCEYQFSSDEIRNIVLFRLPREYQNYYMIVGPDRSKVLGYQRSKLSKEFKILIENREQNIGINKEDLRKCIIDNFSIGKRYLNSDIKESLQELYNKLGVSQKAKAKDVEEYFEVKIVDISIEDGKRQKGYKIIKIK